MIPYITEVKILGIRFGATVEKSAHSTWTAVAHTTNSSARDLYLRNLCLHQSVQAVHTHLLSKLWYVAQVLPTPAQYVRQITTVILWYVWRGGIFRVPVSTLYRKETDSGLNLVDLQAKCMTLYLARLHRQVGNSEG
jgi:hypothetical protein